jgi:hypothetical protein
VSWSPTQTSSARIWAYLAILQAADAITAEATGPTSAESVRAKIAGMLKSHAIGPRGGVSPRLLQRSPPWSP